MEQTRPRQIMLLEFIAEISPKLPNTAMAQRLLRKVEHKSQMLRSVKQSIIATTKKLKGFKEDYAKSRIELVDL